MVFSLWIDDLYITNEDVAIRAEMLGRTKDQLTVQCTITGTSSDFERTLYADLDEGNEVRFTLPAGELPIGDYRVQLYCQGTSISDLFMVVPED